MAGVVMAGIVTDARGGGVGLRRLDIGGDILRS